jgi:3-deoxy-D-manno-octulosonate cytidylyltransferase
MTGFVVVIPARYASTRLPGKALLDIHGKPMLQHVYERGIESGASEVVIATDDERIAAAAEAFDAVVCMTGDHHQSGTERIAEVADLLNWNDTQVVVNLQGDEPAMPPYRYPRFTISYAAGLSESQLRKGHLQQSRSCDLLQPCGDSVSARREQR